MNQLILWLVKRYKVKVPCDKCEWMQRIIDASHIEELRLSGEVRSLQEQLAQLRTDLADRRLKIVKMKNRIADLEALCDSQEKEIAGLKEIKPAPPARTVSFWSNRV